MPTKRPNILLITTDQQRWDAVGRNRDGFAITPALDRLARQGVNFSNSFCAAAACQPSRASILTGLYPPAHGVMRTGGSLWLPDHLETFPTKLRRVGYHTMAVGKMHSVPWDHLCGFDRRVIIESKYSLQLDEYREHLLARGLKDQLIGHHTPGFGLANKAMPSPLSIDDHIDGYIGRRSCEELDALLRGEQPFMMWASFCGPHDPYDPPAPYSTLYNPADMPLPRRAPGELDQLPPTVRQKSTAFGVEKMNLWGISDKEHQRLRALYLGNVSLIDACIGRLLDQLDQAGAAENTLVIFTSDHADYLGDHDLLWKAFMPSDADMRVPLIMRWPAALKAQQSSAFVSGVDLMPTMLAAANAGAAHMSHGLNLLEPANRNGSARDHLLMFSEPNRWRWRNQQWAYTRWPDQPFDTLFDLVADPDELHNLARAPKHQATLASLNRQMQTELSEMVPPCVFQ